MLEAALDALMTAMVTDGWEGFRTRIAKLFRRGDALEQLPGPDLDEERQRLVWRSRLEDLLAQHPEAEQELRVLVADMQAAAAGQVTVNATAAGHAQQGVLGRGVQHNVFGGQRGPEPDRL